MAEDEVGQPAQFGHLDPVVQSSVSSEDVAPGHQVGSASVTDLARDGGDERRPRLLVPGPIGQGASADFHQEHVAGRVGQRVAPLSRDRLQRIDQPGQSDAVSLVDHLMIQPDQAAEGRPFFCSQNWALSSGFGAVLRKPGRCWPFGRAHRTAASAASRFSLSCWIDADARCSRAASSRPDRWM